MFDPTVTYDDLAWIRDQWPGKVVVKGVQTVDDARRVRDVGVDAVLLSNHGGRQLDRAPVPFHLLPEVAAAVGDDVEVHLDTGIMSGQDIVAAVAHGARFTLVGRAYLYGLMAGGRDGVDRVIEILSGQVERTMRLLGVTTPRRAHPRARRHDAAAAASTGALVLMDEVRSIVLVLATIATGLTAGVFWSYGNAVMPGLRATDDRTFVAAFQSIDRAIINPWFLGGGFFGALILTAVAAAMHLGDDWRSALPWIVAAFVLHLVVVIITVAINVPLNDAIKAAGDPATIDVDAVREAFSEAKWVAWNQVRIVLDIAAFAALGIALVLHGRAGV